MLEDRLYHLRSIIIITPIFQKAKFSVKEVKQLAQSDTAGISGRTEI